MSTPDRSDVTSEVACAWCGEAIAEGQPWVATGETRDHEWCDGLRMRRERDDAVAEVERLHKALRPFRALADAIDTMGGLTDEEWMRLKPRVIAYATNARAALDITAPRSDQ